MVQHISNALARRIFLAKQGLSTSPSRKMDKAGLLEMITQLGFVQLDSIQTVSRAHDQILFTRNQTYQPEHLRQLLEEDRALFEHWTHDASILPTTFYPYWKQRFPREEQWWRTRMQRRGRTDFDKAFAGTLDHIRSHGAVFARELKEADHVSGGWWNWHPSKTALEFYWQTGVLSIARREGFQKVYDLSERVIPAPYLTQTVTQDAYIDWACRQALSRLGFATSGEISAFWRLITPQEAKAWIDANESMLQRLELACSDGGKPRACYALPELDLRPDAWPDPPARVRVLSPFDPLIRDRNRTERLFGFHYRIEMFVPEAKRQYGYYVFPLLEKDRLIGRIDMKAHRKEGVLKIRKLWLHPRIRASKGRLAAIDAELVRIARFVGVPDVIKGPDWHNT